jgi:serine/threonine-protein kinase
VALLDAGEDAGLCYIAFAYAPASESLARCIARSGPLPRARVTRLAAEVGSALDALHAAGIIHRDVKPSNIILAGESARLTDFGLAKGAAYAALTRPGQILGTTDYLAPELIRGGAATPASDLYAFGCTLYECVAGAPPFAGRSLLAVGMAQLSEAPADPTRARPEYPPGFGPALLSALAKDPAARPADASAYARLLAAHASAA